MDAEHSRSFRISQGSSTLHSVQGGYSTGGVHQGGLHPAGAPRPRNRRSKSLCQDDMEDVQVAVGLTPGGAPHHAPAGGGGMRRTLSGTLARAGGGPTWQDELAFQQTYKGPSHRTISRITNRQQQHQQQTHQQTHQHHVQQQQQQTHLSPGWAQECWAGTGSRPGTMSGGRWGGQQQQQLQYVVGAGGYQDQTLYRAPSVHSVRSVGRGVDLTDRASNHSVDKLGG